MIDRIHVIIGLVLTKKAFIFFAGAVLGVIAQAVAVPALSRFDPTTIAAAIVTVLTALGVLFVTIINAKAAADDRHDARVSRLKLDATTLSTDAKANTIIEKAIEIHALTNSNLSKVTAALDVALARIEGLEKLVASLNEAKRIADTLAAASPAAAPVSAGGSAPPIKSQPIKR